MTIQRLTKFNTKRPRLLMAAGSMQSFYLHAMRIWLCVTIYIYKMYTYRCVISCFTFFQGPPHCTHSFLCIPISSQISEVHPHLKKFNFSLEEITTMASTGRSQLNSYNEILFLHVTKWLIWHLIWHHMPSLTMLWK